MLTLHCCTLDPSLHVGLCPYHLCALYILPIWTPLLRNHYWSIYFCETACGKSLQFSLATSPTIFAPLPLNIPFSRVQPMFLWLLPMSAAALVQTRWEALAVYACVRVKSEDQILLTGMRAVLLVRCTLKVQVVELTCGKWSWESFRPALPVKKSTYSRKVAKRWEVIPLEIKDWGSKILFSVKERVTLFCLNLSSKHPTPGHCLNVAQILCWGFIGFVFLAPPKLT